MKMTDDVRNGRGYWEARNAVISEWYDLSRYIYLDATYGEDSPVPGDHQAVYTLEDAGAAILDILGQKAYEEWNDHVDYERERND